MDNIHSFLFVFQKSEIIGVSDRSTPKTKPQTSKLINHQGVDQHLSFLFWCDLEWICKNNEWMMLPWVYLSTIQFRFIGHVLDAIRFEPARNICYYQFQPGRQISFGGCYSKICFVCIQNSELQKVSKNCYRKTKFQIFDVDHQSLSDQTTTTQTFASILIWWTLSTNESASV
jgi:hypothetical protein